MPRLDSLSGLLLAEIARTVLRINWQPPPTTEHAQPRGVCSTHEMQSSSPGRTLPFVRKYMTSPTQNRAVFGKHEWLNSEASGNSPSLHHSIAMHMSGQDWTAAYRGLLHIDCEQSGAVTPSSYRLLSRAISRGVTLTQRSAGQTWLGGRVVPGWSPRSARCT